MRSPNDETKPGAAFEMCGQVSVSFSRPICRTTAKPNVALSAGWKRSCENGMRNSARQPSVSRETATSQTASQPLSSLPSFDHARSSFTPAGIDAELEGGAPIVERVDDHAQPVGRGIGVAARAQADEPIGLGVVRADGDIEVGRVVDDLDVRGERRRCAVLRIALAEVADRGHVLPDASVNAPSSLIAVASGSGVAGMRGGARGTSSQRQRVSFLASDQTLRRR